MATSPYEEHTERRWYVRDIRGATHQADDERDARGMAAENPAAQSVVLYRDIHYGPLVPVDR